MKLSGSITEQEWRRRELALQNEALTGGCLTCIHAAPDTETALWDVLWHLGERLGCDRVHVFEEMDRLHISNTYGWPRAEIPSGIDQLPYVEKKDLEPWYQEFASGGQIILEDIETIRREEPLLYEFLIPQDIRSIVLSLLLAEGQIRDLLEAGNPPAEKLEYISALFGVLSNFIFGLVSQRELKKLRMKRLPYPQESDAVRFKGKKVLLADNNKEILQINQRMLESKGYGLLTASMLWKASKLLEKTAPDAMVLDVDLPDGGGIAFYRKLRETSDIPTIFLTDHAEFSLEREGLETGGTAYLTKPYRITKLQDTMVAAVSQPKPTESK